MPRFSKVLIFTLLCLAACTPGLLPSAAIEQAVRQTLTALPLVPPLTLTTPLPPATDLSPAETPPVEGPTPPPTEKPTATLAETSKATPPPVKTDSASCVPAGAPQEGAVVTKVIDGDTIEVQIDRGIYRVRYIGIDSPEPGDASQAIAPLAEDAKAANEALLAGQAITLVRDVSETDRYGRLLRYVFVPDRRGLFVNQELLRLGYASAKTYPPDTACQDAFAQAEAVARLAGVGFWAAGATMLGTISPSGGCDLAYPDVCIPPPPPDLDCRDIAFRRFKVLQPDPHNFDGDHNGLGCEK